MTLIPKICMTASGFLIYQDKVLLVKHKKLNMWLGPGGHIEDDELPHQAAEREFLEETGLQVKVYSPFKSSLDTLKVDQIFHPLPIIISGHWVCRENYDQRVSAMENNQSFVPAAQWSRGCEKHFNLAYLVKLTGPLEIKMQEEEATDIAWFTPDDLQGARRQEVTNSIFAEVNRAFELARLTRKDA